MPIAGLPLLRRNHVAKTQLNLTKCGRVWREERSRRGRQVPRAPPRGRPRLRGLGQRVRCVALGGQGADTSHSLNLKSCSGGPGEQGTPDHAMRAALAAGKLAVVCAVAGRATHADALRACSVIPRCERAWSRPRSRRTSRRSVTFARPSNETRRSSSTAPERLRIPLVFESG